MIQMQQQTSSLTSHMHAGEPGAGKSQLALQAVATAQLPESAGGLHGSVVWIYTEGLPPTKRLQQLVEGLNVR